jgi:hypothetical protein
VVGQDLEEDDDGVLRIARKVAKDRVISTVDPEARHGHKTQARGFDGYKGHAAVDPDSEIVTATVVSAGNAGDASVAEDLIADLVHDKEDVDSESAPAGADTDDAPASTPDEVAAPERPAVYGDNAYGTGPFHECLEDAGIDSLCKTQRPTAAGGLFTKDRFDIDLEDDTVTCPNHVTVGVTRHGNGGGIASFGDACATCPLRVQCTKSNSGRTVSISPQEAALARARARQADPSWRDEYRATRPKVERKLAHLMRRKHGGRRARVRGTARVDADFRLLAAAVNLARLAALGARSTTRGWAVAGG